jgi:hypothetical protein
VVTNTGDVIIDTGLISTGDNFNIYGPMLIDACDLSVCLDAPTAGTLWVLEVESDCGAVLNVSGGQNEGGNPYCWTLNPSPCGGCPSVEEITGASSITIGGSVNGVVIPAQSVSIVEPYGAFEYSIDDEWAYGTGSAGAGGCGAGNSLTRHEYYGHGQSVSVGFSILKENNVCKVAIGASYGFFGPADYWASGSGGTTIPLANLIGTHSFTFPVTGCQQFHIGDDSEGNPIFDTSCNTIGMSAEISIS